MCSDIGATSGGGVDGSESETIGSKKEHTKSSSPVGASGSSGCIGGPISSLPQNVHFVRPRDVAGAAGRKNLPLLRTLSGEKGQ